MLILSYQNGRIIALTQKVHGRYPENTRVYVGCNPGHVLGTAYTICTNGTWLPPPKCIGNNNTLLKHLEGDLNDYYGGTCSFHFKSIVWIV